MSLKMNGWGKQESQRRISGKKVLLLKEFTGLPDLWTILRIM